MSLPLKINNYHLIDIMDPIAAASCNNDDEKIAKSIQLQMYPSEVALISETYSKDTERTANYELENITLVNRKAKPEFTWDCIKADYIKKLFEFLSYKYNFKNSKGDIIPENAPVFDVTYYDFVGWRTIKSYLGQTIDGTLEENAGVLYWRNLRIAFPEL